MPLIFHVSNQQNQRTWSRLRTETPTT